MTLLLISRLSFRMVSIVEFDFVITTVSYKFIWFANIIFLFYQCNSITLIFVPYNTSLSFNLCFISFISFELHAYFFVYLILLFSILCTPLPTSNVSCILIFYSLILLIIFKQFINNFFLL